MYDLVDRPVAELPAFERRILDATRRWVHALTLAGHAPVDDDDTAFGQAMDALNRGSTDTLVVQRPCHSTVEETEAVILSLWRLVRADRLGTAHSAAATLAGSEGRAMIAAMTSAARNDGRL